VTSGRVPLSVRRATLADAERLFDWFNDAETRAASFSPADTTWETHCVWLERVLNDPRRWLYVVSSAEGDAIGQARFDQQGDDCAEVSFSLAPAFRGRRLAASAIRAATNAVLSESSLRILDAYVKPGNERSRRAFVSAGYAPMGQVQHAEHEAWQLRFESDVR